MKEARLPEDEDDRLAALYALNILDTPVDERFDRITRTLRHCLDAPIAYIALVDKDRQWFKSEIGMGCAETPRGVSFCGHTILQRSPLIVPDTTKDVRFADNPMVVGEPFARFYAGWPLGAADGQRVGTLCIMDTKARDYLTTEEMGVFRDLAEMAEDQLTLTDLASVQTRLRETRQTLEKKNTFLRQVFGKYLADEVVDRLLRDPDALALGGKVRDVTIVMADLRGFTALSDQWQPSDVVDALNIYFDAIVKTITAHGGIVDNIVGDGIVSLFGVPEQSDDDACQAVACAIAMQNAMTEVNDALHARGLPQLGVGVGVNSGEVIVGNVGSDQFAKYSAIGSPMNIASRVEALSLSGQVLITDETLKRTNGRVRTAGTLRVKARGVEPHILIHDAVGVDGDASGSVPGGIRLLHEGAS